MNEICSNRGDINWGDIIFNENQQFVANRMIRCSEKDVEFIVPRFKTLTEGGGYFLEELLFNEYTYNSHSARIRVMLTLDLKEADITENNNGEWIIK